jgi:hypothetical protein
MNAIKNNDITLYFMLGRAHAWDSEASPDTVEGDVDTHYSAWDSAYALRKVEIDDVAFVAERADWEKDTVYDEYDDDDETIYDTPRTFIVLDTDDLDIDNNKVYKVINNNSGGGSTVEPDSYRTGVFGTPSVDNDDNFDGYQWIVMYQIEACDFEKFVTSDWVFVPETSAAGSLGQQACESAIPGAVYQVKITNGGSGYTDGTYRLEEVAVDSNGTGFAADATVSGGTVTQVSVLAYGKNYTRLSLDLPSSAGAGSSLSLRPIISPPNGHGASAVDEIKPYSIMVYAKIEGYEDDTVSVLNDFRQYGIIVDPKTTSGDIASDDTYDLTTHLTVSSLENTNKDKVFELDEWVYVGTSLATATAKARVLHWENTDSSDLRLINIRGTFSSGDEIKGDTSLTTATIDSVSQKPSINIGDGEFIYLANRTKVERDEDQAEEFKIVLNF